MMSRTFLLVIYVVSFQCSSAAGNSIKTELIKAYGKAVSGDIRPILSVLESVEDVNQSEFSALREKYEERFITADERVEFDDPFVTNLYGLYTAYWRSSLLNPKNERKAGKILVSGLYRLAKSEGYKATLFESFIGPNIKKLELFLGIAARGKGYYVLMGRTPPLRELIIWTKEEGQTYEVELPSESFSVDVVFVQGLLSRGWLGYATFDKSHAGGWCFGGPIYRVGPKPGDNNEWFRVSLLGHEGRHMSDGKRYEKVDGWILEYRAKLTELVLAETTLWNLLNQFKSEAQDDISIPHSYASYQLINDLMGELAQGQKTESFHTFRFTDYSKDRLKDAAELLLDKNTKSLEAK
ncbi:MAG: hypothetical protein JSU94_04750 [Phycisphaerales bacterium]|nr:MAG: hypothetical protein JSU94_04750 [Phycisphaerales bacterium]